jgi:tRNA(Leu) C34 or U34 (ribose-2'-O)-methylase TrmL
MNSDDIRNWRRKTRRERYEEKAPNAQTMPISVACIDLSIGVNVAHIIRATACFGGFEACLIGGMAKRSIINDLSGSNYDYMRVRQFSTPEDFVCYCKSEGIRMVALELPSESFPAVPLKGFEFDFERRTCFIVGHESFGVPVEILAASEVVFIELKGFGACLNVAQTANIVLFEAARRYWG